MIHTHPEMLHGHPEMIHTHQTAPTQFVEANGIRFAYRRSANPAECRSFSTSTSPAPWTIGIRR